MKTASLAAVILALVPVSCRKAEVVELATYPETSVGFSIADVEGNPSVITLNATYDGEGVLTADGEITRTYIFTMSSPSPEDVVFGLEAIHEGLPAEYVELEKTKLTIPAGYKSASVDVTFKPEDLSFASNDAEVYEVGVRVKDMEGFQVSFEGEPEAKVIVEKAPYISEATVVIDGSGANSITFKRSYVEGKIINEDIMSLDFKVVVNRPALTDLVLPVAVTGLPAGFEKSFTLSEPTIKIAAGEKESSNVITCTIPDDFLLVGEDPEVFPLEITLDTDAVASTGVANPLHVTVNKVLDLMAVVTADEFASLTKHVPSGWAVTGDGNGSPGAMFDGVNTGYNDYYYFYYFTVDFKESIPLNGFKVYCYYNSISYMPNHFTVEVSDDGETWMSLGEVEDGRSGGHPVHVMFLKNINARYLKFTSLESSRYSTDFVEFELYHK